LALPVSAAPPKTESCCTRNLSRRFAGEGTREGRGDHCGRGVDLIAAEERDAEARHAAESKAQPLCEIANAYLESVKRLRSWRDIESRIRCHIIPRLGHKQIGEITRADVVEFLDGLERKLGLRHQVNRCRETLRAIFAFAIERDQIAVNPILVVAKRKVEPFT